MYTQAISFNPFVAAYYGNRSFAYIKTEFFGYALADANKALELDNTYVKVWLLCSACSDCNYPFLLQFSGLLSKSFCQHGFRKIQVGPERLSSSEYMSINLIECLVHRHE
jgi:hypothetical protein